jgi:hypothetical protein
MPAWWNSLEAVTALTWWLRWIGAGLTIIGGLCVVATLVTSKRAETLRERRSADRRLTGEQRAAIKAALKASPKGRIAVISMTDSIESYKYASDFAEVLVESGWEVRLQPILRLSEGEPPTGLILVMENPQAVPDWVNPLFKAIEGAGVKIEAQTAPQLIDNAPISLVIAYKR